MLKNYLLVSFRNLFRQKTYSFINIFGLSVAIAVSVLIFMFIRIEFSTNKFHKNSDSIFRVNQKIQDQSGNIRKSSTTALPLAPDLKRHYPEIKNAIRISSNTTVIKRGENIFSETVVFVDAPFFDVFSFPIIKGKDAPLSDLNAIVPSENMAAKYFGDKDPIGETFTLSMANEDHIFVVTAVADNMRQSSSLEFDFLVNIEKSRWITPGQFTSYSTAFSETYVQLTETAKASELEAKFSSFVKEVVRAGRDGGTKVELYLQPLADIYLDSEIPQTIVKIGNLKYSYILSGLGILVLLISCINFIILSVGKSASRAKEIGVRKVMGAHRSQLTAQYIGEAVTISFLSMFLGLALAAIMLPTFNTLSGKEIPFSIDFTIVTFLLVLVTFVGLAAGSYPAIFLSRFQPALVLKGNLIARKKSALSKSLVVLQFGLSVFLIIVTLVIHEQVEFMREKNLGYNKERVLEISLNNPPNAEVSNKLFQSYKSELIKNSNVLDVDAVMNEFGTPWTKLMFGQADGSTEDLFFNLVDIDFIKTMGMAIVQGRDFSEQFGTDKSQAILVNEALVKHFGWADPLNESIPGSQFTASHQIIGVVRDFHFSSMHNKIEPLILALNIGAIRSGITNINTWNWPPLYNRVVVRIGPGETRSIVDFLKTTFAAVAPQNPFEMKFLDEIINAQYAQENKWNTIINYISLFAIMIACLGLFGLTTVSVEKRVKEIGIRKVLGSSISGIVSLLSKEMLVLVVFSNLVAWPIAYYSLQYWLQNFAYKIDINILLFLLASTSTLLIAFLTISSQATRAAMVNPVKSLRDE